MERSYEEIKEMVSLTAKQIDCMKHAIGFHTNKVKRGKFIAFRNYFACGNIDENWEYLQFWGLAINPCLGYYKVSRNGIKLLEEILGVRIEVE